MKREIVRFQKATATSVNKVRFGKFLIAVLAGLLTMPEASIAENNRGTQAEHLAEIAAELTCRWAGLSVPNQCGLESVERKEITDRVVEYFYVLRVGLDEYEEIGLHRLIEERQPWRPQHRTDAIMLVHGDVWPFEASFNAAVGSGVVPDEQALPVFLASNDVDAWGIDLRWTRVPVNVADPYAVMENWDFQTDIDDLGIALEFMRRIRAITGSGHNKVALLGWSRGGMLGYAYLGQESTKPYGQRHVSNFAVADVYLKTNYEAARAYACASVPSIQAALDVGIYAVDNSILKVAGDLAIADPDGPSPLIPGLTNGQTIVLDAGIPRPGYTPWYHYLGADLSVLQLLYTEEELAYVHYSRAAPYEPTKMVLEGVILFCDEEDSPYDDNLGDITVPVLYLGANGGFGQYGLYTTTLIGSDDIESHIVSLTGVGEEDFGHTDLFLATEAESLVWRPLLDWIKRH
jgi:pimeloyl-ACP methyl ester carboxylesterase